MSRYLGFEPVTRGKYYFISYNSNDENRVKDYVLKMHGLGMPMWYDNGLKVGDEWEAQIAEKISGCEAVVMFISKNIFLKESSYVHTEYKMAKDLYNKKLYIVILDNIENTDIPFRFAGWWIKVTELQCVYAFEHTDVGECVRLIMKDLDFTPIDDSHAIQIIPLDKNEISAHIEVKEYRLPATANTSDSSTNAIQPVAEPNIKTINYPDGSVYTGEVLNGVPHGKGKLIWASGDIYEGNWVEQTPHGYGKWTWANGNIYEGDFVKWKLTGKGTYIWTNGDIYEGDFVDGAKTGKGKLTWISGTVYEGNFINGKRTGKGKLTYTNGDVYEGDFKDGSKTGKGKFTKADGTVYDGKFSDGMFIEGSIYDKHGKLIRQYESNIN